MRWPRPFARALDELPPSQRKRWSALAMLVALAVAAVVALRLHGAIAHLREDVARDHMLLDVARARTAESAALARANVPPGNRDVRAAIDRVLSAHGLRYAAVNARGDDGGQRIVVDAAPFDALVRALDALMREEGLRVVDATLTARVDPGTVRAELAFGR